VHGLATLALRQRLLLVGGLLGVAAVSWAYLVEMAADMGPACCAPGAGAGMGLSWTLVMWIVMMVAMMVPTATHTTLFYARFLGGRRSGAAIGLPATAFILGYVAAWTLFSLVATAGQLALERAALMAPAMKLKSPLVGGVVLAVAGVFQFTPWKYTCLSNCRSPFGFFMTEWRDGTFGAFRMGLHHGLYCLGCCWALMLLLFVLGTMNLLWIAALTALVLAEKIAPRGDIIARVAGVAMVLGGIQLAMS
jgi:predicted metal-binding membrane protein